MNIAPFRKLRKCSDPLNLHITADLIDASHLKIRDLYVNPAHKIDDLRKTAEIHDYIIVYIQIEICIERRQSCLHTAERIGGIDLSVK